LTISDRRISPQPTLYIPGEKNVVADLLSRYPILPGGATETDIPQASPSPSNVLELQRQIEECFDLPREYNAPVNLKTIYAEQLNDPEVKRLQREAPHRLGTIFDNAGDKAGPHQAITLQTGLTSQIVIPASLWTKLIQWYHEMLIHPGGTVHQDSRILSSNTTPGRIWIQILQLIAKLVNNAKRRNVA
jgi:hypothetical protein